MAEEEVELIPAKERRQTEAGAYKENLSQDDKVKAELIKALLGKVNVTNEDLVEISGLKLDIINSIRTERFDEKDAEEIYSWDYVLAFDVGDEEGKHKPTKADHKRREYENLEETDDWKEGMPEQRYNGQVMMDFMNRLKAARLAVKAYVSAKKDMMFLVVGISEKNLKYWADVRDTDLLIDAEGAIKVGVEKKFPLALRTDKGDIDKTNWDHLYVEYHPNADPRIYTSYNRIRDNEDIKTVFDEKTRLRIIYECITTDQNDGGAEIAVTDLVAQKKHPLIACFPLHNPKQLKKFEDEWIRNWNPKQLLNCPLDEVRDYFGEPVGFYFGFLSFYMYWLLIPTFIGIIFFCLQIGRVGAHPAIPKENTFVFDVSGLFILGFCVIFWSVAFVDFWARQEARLRMKWGMTNYAEKAVARPQFKGEWKPDPVSGLFSEQFDFGKKLCRITTILSFLFFFLLICVSGVIAVLLLKDSNPNDTGLKIGLGVANGVMISIFNVIYKITSTKGNDFENHKTEQDYENALIGKGFVFKFINSFSSLFYLAFIRPGVQGLEYYVHYYDTVCGSANSYMFNYVQSFNAAYTVDKAAAEKAFPFIPRAEGPRNDPNNGPITLSCNNEATATDSCIRKVFNNDDWTIVWQGYSGITATGSAFTVKAQSGCEQENVLAQQNEAVLNELFFQLVSLFGTALVIQNVIEVGLPFLCAKCRENKRIKDAQKRGEKLLQPSEAEEQSEKDVYENTIEDMTELIVQFGYVTLFVMAFPLTPLLALINNIFEMKVDATNLVMTSQRPHPIGAYGLGTWNSVLSFFSIISVATNVGMLTFRTGTVALVLKGIPAGQWIFFSVLSIILGLIVSAEKAAIPDVPEQVLLIEERQRLVQNVLVRNAKPDDFEEEPPDTSDDVETDVFPFDPKKEFIDFNVLEPIPLDNLQYDTKESS